MAGDVVKQAVHAVSAALITGDPRTVAQTASWVSEVLTVRGAGFRAAIELGEVLGRALNGYPLARELVGAHWARGPEPWLPDRDLDSC